MIELMASFRNELAQLLPLAGGALGCALCLFLLTTTLTACSIPGTLIPMSLTGGALIGPAPTVAAVVAGAMTGSLLLFLLTRRIGAERLRARFGHALKPQEARLSRYGPFAVVLLRMAGIPGPLITAGAAMSSMRAVPFATATLFGLLPSVTLAAAGSSALVG